MTATTDKKYFGSWDSLEQVLSDFKDDGCEQGKYVRKPLEGLVPTDNELLFASYGGGSYDGNATVIFEKDGVLYEVGGGHCSCYGLEGQWSPGKVTWEALAIRLQNMEPGNWGFLDDHEPEAREAFKALVRCRFQGRDGE
jgi:hypothetical protein